MQIDLSGFDLETLEIGELEDMEDVSGLDAEEIAERLKTGRLPARLLKAVVWVVGRRGDPAFTIEAARRVKFADIVGAEEETTGVTDPEAGGESG